MNAMTLKFYIFIITIFLYFYSSPINGYYLESLDNENEMITPSPYNSGSDTLIAKVITDEDNSKNGIPIVVEERSSNSPRLIGVVKAITDRQNPTMSRELIAMIDDEAKSAARYLKTLNNLRQSVILSSTPGGKEKKKRMTEDYLTDDYGFPLIKSWTEYSGGNRFKRGLPAYYDIDFDLDYSW
uniref:Nematode cuticle collagen N-terminal domain-containing protein n=1 Tax=Strongyloides stercoralis TaxID=6248 RepID=A0A0K0EMW1_STRER